MNSEMAYSNSPSSILHAQTRCRSVHARGFTLDEKTVENQDWATGLPGRRAAGPSRAVGRGPLGRGPAFSKGDNYFSLTQFFTFGVYLVGT